MRVTVCVRVCEAIQETMVWQCWEDDFKDAIAEHLKGTSTPTLSYKVKEREAAVQVPDVGRPAADLDTSACTSKGMLLAALDSQVAHINADLDRDYCTVNEQTLDAIRRDFPAPTVHARNLFHLSAAMWGLRELSRPACWDAGGVYMAVDKPS